MLELKDVKRKNWILTVSDHDGFRSHPLNTLLSGRQFPQDHIVRGKSPSPTHIASASAAHLRSTYGHQRHESDTLRSAGNLPPQQPQALAPVQSQSTSPKLTEAPPPPRAPVASVRHRRSPTSEPIPAAGEDDVAHVPVAEVKTRNLVVSKKAYARLDLIGKGGSSRVYRVMNNANEIYAIKRVSLDKTDAETMSGYMNEIALLKRLSGNSRIIRLVDSEVKPGPGETRGHLMLVMECGEIGQSRIAYETLRSLWLNVGLWHIKTLLGFFKNNKRNHSIWFGLLTTGSR
jgi:Protein kinase domain